MRCHRSGAAGALLGMIGSSYRAWLEQAQSCMVWGACDQNHRVHDESGSCCHIRCQGVQLLGMISSCYVALHGRHAACARRGVPVKYMETKLLVVTCSGGAGALLGMISSCYVALYGQARIMCVVARDHMLPPVLARIAPATGTPVIAAVVMGTATGAPKYQQLH